MPDSLFVTSVGIGPTDGGATFNRTVYGADLVSQLPFGTIIAETLLARAPCQVSGWAAAQSTGKIWVPIHSGISASAAAYGEPRPGIAVTLLTAATRGRQVGCPTTDIFAAYGPDLNAAIYRLVILPMVVQVVTPGSGSAFAAGEMAFAVLTDSFNATSALTRMLMTASGTGSVAMGLYIIPADLL
jgi:hypothetical protein